MISSDFEFWRGVGRVSPRGGLSGFGGEVNIRVEVEAFIFSRQFPSVEEIEKSSIDREYRTVE